MEPRYRNRDSTMKCHYIPRFLLRPFCTNDAGTRDPKGRVWVCRRAPNGALRHERRSPDSTGFVHDLLTQRPSIRGLENPLWERTDAIERGYSQKLETPAALVRDKLLAGTAPSQLTAEERGVWAQFLATLEHRTPRKINRLDEQAEKLAEDAILEFLAMAGDSANTRNVLSRVDVGAIAANIVRGTPLRQSGDLAKPLLELTWACLAIDQGLEFVTTDYPLGFFENGSQRSLLFLPLSPRVLFLALPVKDNNWGNVPWLLAQAANLQLIYQRPNFIYSSGRLEDGPVQKLLKAAEDTLEAPEYQLGRS